MFALLSLVCCQGPRAKSGKKGAVAAKKAAAAACKEQFVLFVGGRLGGMNISVARGMMRWVKGFSLKAPRFGV